MLFQVFSANEVLHARFRHTGLLDTTLLGMGIQKNEYFSPVHTLNLDSTLVGCMLVRRAIAGSSHERYAFGLYRDILGSRAINNAQVIQSQQTLHLDRLKITPSQNILPRNAQPSISEGHRSTGCE